MDNCRWSSTQYRRLRNGNAIAGATHRTYVVQGADRGKKIKVKVTATKRGYAKGATFSASRRVEK